MTARNVHTKGFTLVEILIVVVILGILAAIVIPQFTSASESARASSLISQLQTIRSQLELYQVQHGGDYPSLAGGQNSTAWTAMTEEDSDGYGPYLQQAPVNPFQDSSAVNESSSSDGSVSAAEDKGWAYNSSTGTIKAIIDTGEVTPSDLGLDSEDYIAE